MAKETFKCKIWPRGANGEKSESTYQIEISDFKELPDRKRFWKMEIL